MRPLLFNANDQESIYLEDNKISWSEYCHRNLERDMNNQKYVNSEKYQMPFVMMIIGLLILLIGVSNIFNAYVTLLCLGMSLFSISFGLFSLIGSYKYGR